MPQPHHYHKGKYLYILLMFISSVSEHTLVLMKDLRADKTCAQKLWRPDDANLLSWTEKHHHTYHTRGEFAINRGDKGSRSYYRRDPSPTDRKPSTKTHGVSRCHSRAHWAPATAGFQLLKSTSALGNPTGWQNRQKTRCCTGHDTHLLHSG